MASGFSIPASGRLPSYGAKTLVETISRPCSNVERGFEYHPLLGCHSHPSEQLELGTGAASPMIPGSNENSHSHGLWEKQRLKANKMGF